MHEPLQSRHANGSETARSARGLAQGGTAHPPAGRTGYTG